eukprot:c33267_g1_i1 orf=74-373(-)
MRWIYATVRNRAHPGGHVGPCKRCATFICGTVPLDAGKEQGHTGKEQGKEAGQCLSKCRLRYQVQKQRSGIRQCAMQAAPFLVVTLKKQSSKKMPCDRC